MTHLEKAGDAIKKANLKLTKVGKRLQPIDSEWRYHIIFFLLHLYRYFCANESSPITMEEFLMSYEEVTKVKNQNTYG